MRKPNAIKQIKQSTKWTLIKKESLKKIKGGFIIQGDTDVL